MSKYVLHVFIIPLNRSDDWKSAEEIIYRVSHEECKAYAKDAERNMARLVEKEGLAMPKVEPRVRFHLSPKGQMEMLVRIPAPARKKGDIEQTILKRFMEEFTFYEKK